MRQEVYYEKSSFSTTDPYDLIRRQKTLVLISIGTALTMSAFIFSSSLYTIFPLLALLGIFMFANGPIMLSVIHELDTNMPTFILPIKYQLF